MKDYTKIVTIYESVHCTRKGLLSPTGTGSISWKSRAWRDILYTNRWYICIVTIILSVFLVSCSAIAAASPQSNVNKISELNDSSLNNTLAIYPFFILDYYEPGCDPCQRMNATLVELSLGLSGQAGFGKINAKENSRTAETYNITSYPTLLIFQNKTLVEKDVGFGSKSMIVGKLRMLKPDLNTSVVMPV